MLFRSDYMAEDGGRAATERLLEENGGRPPSSIVYLSNRMAVGGVAILAAAGFVPGRDVSVIVFGDSATLRYGRPAMTAVQAPNFEMARHAVDVLIAMRDRQPIEPIRHWKTTLVVRDSDGPPAAFHAAT